MVHQNRKEKVMSKNIPKAIWKFILPMNVGGYGYTMTMPEDAKILSIGIQDDNICIWAQVNPENTNTEPRHFFIVGTGHVIHYNKINFIGRVTSGAFEWHIFERIEE